MEHIINLCVSVKYFIKTGNISDLNKDIKYVNSTLYHAHDKIDISSFDSFTNYLTKRKLKYIHLILQNINDVSLLGFTGVLAGGAGLVFAYEDGNFIWNASWKVNESKSSWDTCYKEKKIVTAFGYTDIFKKAIINNESAFTQTLEEIHNLAKTIDADSFAAVFSDALSILKGEDCPKKEDGFRFHAVPEFLPEENRRLLAAAKLAWVYGGMGSWVDSPPYQAGEKGLSAKYKELTGRLYSDINQALLYAVNAW